MDATHKTPISERTWLPFAWIIAASALAHLWCLGSVFFLDDDMQIERNAVVAGGQFWTMGANAWTYLWYAIEYRLFGISAPGFHAVNWLLHTSVACMFYPLCRDLLRGRTGLALFAAVLFAVHPLGSEIPNYARTQDLAWVTLFSLFAAWRMFHLAQGGSWKNALLVALGVAGATFSKGPGLLHALMMCGTVGLAFLKADYWAFLRRRRWLAAGILVALVLGLLGLGKLKYGFDLTRYSEPRFIGQAYTLSRVFWEFAWRSIIPVALSADHHIAETLVPPGTGFLGIPDQGAKLAAAALLALTGLSVFLSWRESSRIVGVCLFIYCGTILFRVLYLVPEFMPEYRIYPGLPWFCLGAAIALHASLRKFNAIQPRLPVGILLAIFCSSILFRALYLSSKSMPEYRFYPGLSWFCLGAAVILYVAVRKFTEIPPRVPAVILVAVFIVLSAKRSFLWHDLRLLLGDVLQQYPAQSRALWELDERDVKAGNWQEIITRQRTAWPEVFRRFIDENKKLAPARELPSGHFALAEVACRGSYALALARTEGAAAGMREIDQQEIYMRRLGLDPVAHSIHWGYFFYNKAMVLETAGRDAEAIALLERKGVPRIGKLMLKRLRETPSVR